MASLTENMKEIFQAQKAFVLGTASREGIPNVVPVTAVKLYDDETILVSDQFFKKTLDNLRENSLVAISFWKGVEGYQVKGEAKIVDEGSIFEETADWIRKMAEEQGLPIASKGAVLVRIKEVYSVSPGPEAGKLLAS